MTHHTIAHIDIPTMDASATSAFYHDVLGWKIMTNLEHNYTTYQCKNGLRGGFQGPSEGPAGAVYHPDRLMVYLATDDIDMTLANVEAHGGKVVQPKTEIPHVGWWAIFTDPAGNHLGLFKRQAPHHQ